MLSVQYGKWDKYSGSELKMNRLTSSMKFTIKRGVVVQVEEALLIYLSFKVT